MAHDAADVRELEASLGLKFRDPALLEQALVHRSYFNENPHLPIADNERLEFLGDAVLGFVIAELVYDRFPELTEGGLTRVRSALVRQETLGRIAARMQLGKYLRLGKGEEASGGRQRQKTQAQALEALIGAVLIDQGFHTARAFILHLLVPELDHAHRDKIVADPKGRLQELVQSRMRLTPVYRTVGETGPDHAKKFTVEAVAGEVVLGWGSGRSKRAAETDAARDALKLLTAGTEQPS